MDFRPSRRLWVSMLAALPGLAQVTSKVPPEGSPSPAAPGTPPSQALTKALQNVHDTQEQLATLEVPMNVEPAFQFRA